MYTITESHRTAVPSSCLLIHCSVLLPRFYSNSLSFKNSFLLPIINYLIFSFLHCWRKKINSCSFKLCSKVEWCNSTEAGEQYSWCWSSQTVTISKDSNIHTRHISRNKNQPYTLDYVWSHGWNASTQSKKGSFWDCIFWVFFQTKPLGFSQKKELHV